MPSPRSRFVPLAVSVALALAACGGSASTGTPAGTSAPASSGGASASSGAAGVTTAGITPERCAANKKAGKITYLSGFDLAASASIVEVVVAEKKGYFDAMCLDVDVTSSFSTANYPLVGANTAQFASSGSYAELLNFSKDGAKLVAVTVDGKVGIDALLVRADGGITTPAGLKGKTIGVKGALPPAEVALLNKYGLKQGTDYKEVSLEGFDPKQHWAQPIDALPVYKSNEPGQLDAAGIKYRMFDPATEGIPGNFGLIYTNAAFLKDHPTAVQDFVRAALRGMEDALSDPQGAVSIAFAAVTAGGNKNFLSQAGESYRWGIESTIVKDSTPAGEGVGLVHAADLTAIVDAYTKAGVFTTKPDLAGTYDESIAAGVYDGTTVIWPAG